MKKEKRGRRSPCESRILENFGFHLSRLDERLRRYTFQRLHHRCPRCESQAACRVRPAKNGGTSSNVVIRRVEGSSPTGEFDPGSERTLAAGLTHASRAGVAIRQRQTGE